MSKIYKSKVTGSASTDRERTILLEADLVDPPDTRLARTLVLSSVLAVIFAGVWASFAPVKEVVVGEGRILPIGAHQTIQHIDGGRVETVFVREGDLVTAGTPLVRFDRSDEFALVHQLETRVANLRAELARVQAVAQGTSPSFHESHLRTNEMWSAQSNLFLAETEARRARLEMLQADVDLVLARQAETQDRIDFLERRETIQAARLERLSQLAETSGSVSVRDVEVVELDLIETQSDLAALKARERTSAVELTRAHTARDAFALESHRASLENVASLQARLAETEDELERYSRIAARDTVLAPLAGRIQSLAVNAPEQVVQPGGEILSFIPEDRELIAVLSVSSDRIGTIEPGHPVSIKVLTFDATRFGSIDGHVVDVSPSSDITADGASTYTVRVELANGYVGAKTANLVLRPGLAAVGDIVLGERTVMQYLLKPLRAAQDRAFSES